MSRFALLTLNAALLCVAGCPDDDDFGNLNFDSGPPPDAGPAPNDLPINVGDEFRYQSRSRTPNGCVGGFIDNQCEEQGMWYLDLQVTDKVPDKATEVVSGTSCAAGMRLVEPTRDRCASCPSDDVPTLLNGAIDLEGVPGPQQVYCIPARGWDNVYQLSVIAEYNVAYPHPAPANLANSWFYNLGPWDPGQTAPFEGEKTFRTNVAMLPRSSKQPFPWALDLSKWEVVSQEFLDHVMALDSSADVQRPEGGAYMKATMNYDLNGVAVRHTIEVLYHERGYLCKYYEEFGPPAEGSERNIRTGDTGSLIMMIDVKKDPDTLAGVATIGGQSQCDTTEQCPNGFSWRGDDGDRRCRRLFPRCCTPGVQGCN